MNITMDMPDAKPLDVGKRNSVHIAFGKVEVAKSLNRTIGAANILRAFTQDDFPDDPEQIFLTSWGEWWSKDVYAESLDKALQDKWCPGKEEIEQEDGLVA